MRVNPELATRPSHTAGDPHGQAHRLQSLFFLTVFSTTKALFNMSLAKVSPGKNVPESFNVIIEIPMNADPVKYEVDKESGAIFVDRFMSTSMHYPTNYGYVPRTICGDGDPVDVLVITPVTLMSGVVVTCRPIGILKMTDEAGEIGRASCRERVCT